MTPNFKEKLPKRNHALDNHFTKKTLQFKRKHVPDDEDDSDEVMEGLEPDVDEDGFIKVERTGVFCKDITEFTNFLIDERALDPNDTTIKIGIDDGQNLLKVCMSLQSLTKIASEDKKARSTYADVSIFSCLFTCIIHIFLPKLTYITY